MAVVLSQRGYAVLEAWFKKGKLNNRGEWSCPIHGLMFNTPSVFLKYIRWRIMESVSEWCRSEKDTEMHIQQYKARAGAYPLKNATNWEKNERLDDDLEKTLE